MKRMMIAGFASLMLAGALSAVTGATSVGSVETVFIVGTGSAPVPTALPEVVTEAQSASTVNNF